MSLGESFCIICGGPPPLYMQRMCESCMRQRHTISSLPERIQFTRCARSGTIETDFGWVELDDEALHDLMIKRELELHEEAEDVIVDIQAQALDERNTRLEIHVEGSISGMPFSDRHTTVARCSNGASPAASRLAGNYFEATVQLRSIGRKLDEVELEELRCSLDTKIDDMPDNPMFFITSEGPVPGGYDVTLGSKSLARAWARSLTNRWGGQVKESNKVVGKRDGADLSRLTVLYRKPGFDLGDLLRWRGESWLIFAWLSNGANLLRVSSNQRTGASWRDLEDSTVIARVREQIEVTPLRVDSGAIEFLDERDWKTKVVAKPWDWQDSDSSVILAFVFDEWVSLPRVSSRGDVQNPAPKSDDVTGDDDGRESE